MSVLHYHNGQLYLENVSLTAIADKVGTPTYVYSRSAIESNWRAFDQAFNRVPHRICYAVKANSNLSILRLLAKLHSGFDIVSGGELERVLAAGGDPKKIIFSGVGKSKAEIERAIHAGIYCFNVESIPEIERLQTIASKLNTRVAIALRINPDVDPHTHAHISTGLKENKFGIAFSDVLPLCQRLKNFPALNLIGIACHIGSQITDLTPFLLAVKQLIVIYTELQNLGISLQHLNVGGGLGISYQTENPPPIQEYASALQSLLSELPLDIILEPGRAIVGDSGVLLTRIEYIKQTEHKNFIIVDAGMNDLIRPALYDAWQNILPVMQHEANPQLYDIAGPVCESADFLGKDRQLTVQDNDLLAIDTAGAYGFSMSSNYNSRRRPCEVLVEGNQYSIIRPREDFAELFASELNTACCPID